ncbi:type IV pilus biogenesis/stability protein PilW [Variovorax dokdonensis]|uniref:Type IV pilus biogenesis/stability protein PilW n=1 Tax=Variovorax dokdonensis TaxID=344883 RepID=A0ABT7N829_9BURK|nr:type IV pilus biogenesis/stability protein PilW [Variovorax dokdonensis]MDM0044101.1 type IV pilus biogenesis/stability protein PilW [Variovorax dokdonensis]
MSFALPNARAGSRCLLFAALAAFMLAGCVSTTSTRQTSDVSFGAEQVPQTASDEGQARKRARLRLELALGYFQNGQTNVALDEVKQALAIDPGYGDAYNLRGLVYMRLDDPGLAEDSFRRAISINPRDGNAMHNYGWLLCQQKRYGDGIGQFQRALETPGYADQAKTLMTMGVCDMQAGRSAEAERALTRAYEIDPNNPIVAYNLALLLSQRQDWARAQFYIRRVNNSQAATAETLWLGVKVERQLNNREAAGQLGAQLTQRFPQSREALAYERGNFND